MIKYIAIENSGNLLKFDTETEQVNAISTEREAIRSITLINEPGVLVDGDVEIPVKNGDLIIRFYERYFNKPMIVVKSKDWKNNINAYNKKMEEERNNMLEQKCCNECCDCENCCKSC